MCDDGNGSRQLRYAQDVVALHDRVTMRHLRREIAGAPLYQMTRPDGLSTFAVTTAQLPHRYVLAIQGFRLAQYLQLGWACRDVVYQRRMFCEDADDLHPEDVHALTVAADGRIVGYVGLKGVDVAADVGLDDPGRRLFPVEDAHGSSLFGELPELRAITVGQVRELKRFVHRRGLADRSLRLRVTLELLLAVGHTLLAQPSVRLLVGDLEENVALRHLMLAGLDVCVLQGTSPALPDSDVMHLMYVHRKSVKPFAALVPDGRELAARAVLLEQILCRSGGMDAVREFGAQVTGSMRKVGA